MFSFWLPKVTVISWSAPAIASFVVKGTANVTAARALAQRVANLIMLTWLWVVAGVEFTMRRRG